MASSISHKRGMLDRPEFDAFVDGYNDLVKSQVFNVKNFGAIGNNVADDTAAFQAAIAAANRAGSLTTGGLQGFGGIVHVPAGIYKITASLDVPEGVSFRGEGMRTSVVIFTINNTTDGLKLVYPAQYGRASFIRDLSFYGSGTRNQVRDVISLTRSGYTRVQNVTVGNAARYGIYQEDGIDVQIRDTVYTGNESCGHFIADSTIGSVNTSTSFHNCYFSSTVTGPGANVTGTDVQFYSCIFESMGGGTDTTNGVGVRIRQGTASLYSPYFENNTWHDIDAGTAGVGTTTMLTVVNPSFISGGYASAIKNSIRCDRVSGGGIFGANFTVHYRGLYMTSNCAGLSVFANPGPGSVGNPNGIGTIEWAGGLLQNYPGLLALNEPATGTRILVGNQKMNIGGGMPIEKADSATASWNIGSTNANASVATNVTLTGAQPGDCVVIGFSGWLNGAPFLTMDASAYVISANTVRVVVTNLTGGTITPGIGTVRVAILRFAPLA